MKTFEIKTVQVVTQEQIDDVVTTALEGGISYWCDGVRIKEGFEPKEEYKYLSDVLTRGGLLELYDSEDDLWLTLDLEYIIKYAGQMEFNFEDYDAIDADALIQRAVFEGEVIYG